MYIYPDNLKSKATLWLWELRDIGIIGIGCLISVFALAQLGWLPPIVVTAVYAHCSKILVTEGQKVEAGTVIAEVGSTGRSTGNHLHFEVRINGEKQNPRSYLP